MNKEFRRVVPNMEEASSVRMKGMQLNFLQNSKPIVIKSKMECIGPV